MSGLNRKTIVGHDYLNRKVTVTTYEDGTKVYVNYSESDFNVDGITVPGRDYKVERRAEK